MQLIRVGAAVLNQTPLDWDGNRRRILAVIERARELEVSLLCLPELCITGYGCDDAFQSTGVQDTALEVLAEIAPRTTGMVVAVGLPLQYRKALFDVVALVVDGHIAGFVAKRFLAGEGVHYEPRWFKPWPVGRRSTVQMGGEVYPLGDLLFTTGDGVGLGFEICEDAWAAERPGSRLAARGADVLLNPSASHFAFGKHKIRRRFVVEGSRTFGVSYLYANLAGNEAGRLIFDGGALIASGGRLLVEGPRFPFAETGLTTAVVDVDETRLQQVRSSSFEPDFEASREEQVRLDYRFPELELPEEPCAEAMRVPCETPPNPWQDGADEREEEFTRAQALGLFDYLRKSRARGYVVSLSGGADSSAVSCLGALAVRLGIAELGEDGFARRLGYLDTPDRGDAPSWIRRLLLCVYQSTRNSSDTTRNAARAVAEALGAEYLELDVDPLVESYTRMVEKAVDRELGWERDDLALQNIQSRVRGPGIWMLANLRGALLLATSNRSEAAVGYATMDGDTCGGLSPIAGIDKAFLRRWLGWLEHEGPHGLGSIPELAAVTAQAPTAELRPAAEEQTDEGDLMPYDLLDAIERAAIGDKKLPLEVYRTMRGRFPELERRQLARWVERFFRLWCRNQWKRERYAPSFHVDDQNLDPKTWCRFPILSGGFEREIAELRAHVARREAAEPVPAAPGGNG